jgi:hypothetical protein
VKLLCTEFVGTNPSYIVLEVKFLDKVVFGKKRFEAKVAKCKRRHAIRTEEEIPLS